MQAPALIAPLALSLAALPAPAPTGDERAAPEIEAKRWYNRLGAPVSLGALRGRTVLIEFWATW